MVNVDVIKSVSEEVCMETVWNFVSLNNIHICRTILMVCTNGNIHRQDWKIGHNKVKDESFYSQIDWFVRNNSNGNDVYTVGSSGFPDVIVKAVESGKEMIINLGTYENCNFVVNNMVVQNAVVYSYNTWAISISKSNGILRFPSNPYWFSKIVRSNSFIQIARWYLESNNLISFSTTSSFSPKYFVDRHWKRILKTDQTGISTNGSLDHLNYFVKNGHRLRVYVNSQVLEGISISITSDELQATTFGSLKLSGDIMATPLTHVIGTISTTGTAWFYEVPIGSDNVGNTITNGFAMEWFVDVRQWQLEYSTQQYDIDQTSYLPVFQNVFESGAKIRLKWVKATNEEVFIVDTIRKYETVYQGFTVKNVKIIESKVYYNFHSFYPNGTVELYLVTFGSGALHDHNVFHNQKILWYANF